MCVCLLSAAPYPLLLAALLGDAKQMRTLINSAASVDGVDSQGRTAAMYCAQVECLQLCIEAKCNLELRDSQGRTAAMYCAQEGNVECLQLCVEAKCNLELRDDSVLLATVFSHMHVYVFMFVLEHLFCFLKLI